MIARIIEEFLYRQDIASDKKQVYQEEDKTCTLMQSKFAKKKSIPVENQVLQEHSIPFFKPLSHQIGSSIAVIIFRLRFLQLIKY